MNREKQQNQLYSKLKQVTAGTGCEIKPNDIGGYRISADDWRLFYDILGRVQRLRGVVVDHIGYHSHSFHAFPRDIFDEWKAREQRKSALIDCFFQTLHVTQDQTAAKKAEFELAARIGALAEFAEIYGIDAIPEAV